MPSEESSAGKPTEALGTQALKTQDLRPVSDDEALDSPYPNQNSGPLSPPPDAVILELYLDEEPHP